MLVSLVLVKRFASPGCLSSQVDVPAAASDTIRALRGPVTIGPSINGREIGATRLGPDLSTMGTVEAAARRDRAVPVGEPQTGIPPQDNCYGNVGEWEVVSERVVMSLCIFF